MEAQSPADLHQRVRDQVWAGNACARLTCKFRVQGLGFRVQGLGFRVQLLLTRFGGQGHGSSERVMDRGAGLKISCVVPGSERHRSHLIPMPVED